jgi:hypothetical protein
MINSNNNRLNNSNMTEQSRIYIPQYKLDEKLYPIGLLTKNEAEPVEVKMLKRSQFPSKVVGTHFNRLLNLGHIDNFHCFYTGVHCWLGKLDNEQLRGEKSRYRLSKEHLSSLRIAKALGLLEKASKTSNLIGVSAYFNYKIGHMPLVLKLWIKKQLESFHYPKDEMTEQNSHKILGYIIYLQKLFLYKQLYPWQTSTYKDELSKKIAEAIYDEMIQIDKEFILIENIEESFQWLKEYNPNWIEKFLTDEINTNTDKNAIITT